ncbi:MAG: 16S rRNA (guanine(966)-N(2))-methyltransferase RsmD [Brevinematia bacterium]
MLRISGGYLKGYQIHTKNKKVKPTSDLVRQAIFNSIDVTSSDFLDMFAGTGAVGIEAISRNAKFVCFVDNNFQLIQQIKSNLTSLKVDPEKYMVIHSTWEKGIKLLENKNKKFDIIFLDPFYSFNEYNKLLILIPKILKESGVIILEHSSRVEIDPPQELKIISSKTYGETTIKFFTL